MRYRELKVGMLITGKPNSGYVITSQYSICKVVGIDELNEPILVEVVDSKDKKDKIGTKWEVDYCQFVKYDGDFVVREEKKETIPIPFPIGSYVIGNDKNCYGCTSKRTICKVVKYKNYFYNKKSGLDSEYMDVKIIRNGEPISGTYCVRPSWFDACDYKPYIGLFSKAYYGKKFIVDGSSISVNGVGKDSPCYAQLIKECFDNGIIKKGE